jgi:hypothetical protein
MVKRLLLALVCSLGIGGLMLCTLLYCDTHAASPMGRIIDDLLGEMNYPAAVFTDLWVERFKLPPRGDTAYARVLVVMVPMQWFILSMIGFVIWQRTKGRRARSHMAT